MNTMFYCKEKFIPSCAIQQLSEANY